MSILRVLIGSAFITFPLSLNTENQMRLVNGSRCLGHFVLKLPEQLDEQLEQLHAEYNLSSLERPLIIDQNTHNNRVTSKQAEFTSAGRHPQRHVIGTSQILSVPVDNYGGFNLGYFYTDGASFETKSEYTARLADEFLSVATDVGTRIRAASDHLPDRAVFCFESGYIEGPITQPDMVKRYQGKSQAASGLKFEFTSEWLAAPEVGFAPSTEARNAGVVQDVEIGDTRGVMVTLDPGQVLRDGGFIVVPESQGSFYYEGISQSSPGLRITLRLSQTAESKDLVDLSVVWKKITESIAPLPALRLR